MLRIYTYVRTSWKARGSLADRPCAVWLGPIVALVQNKEGIALLPAPWLPLIRDQHGNDIAIMEIRDSGGSSHLAFGIVWWPDNENPCAQTFARPLESHRP